MAPPSEMLMNLKSYHRVFIFLLVVLFLTSLLTPWVAWLWDHIRLGRPEWQHLNYPFARIFNRIFMILGILLFFPCLRFLKIGSAAALGLTSFRRDYGYILKGALFALASFIIIVMIMATVDVFKPAFRLTFAEGLERSFKAVMTALTVGLVEEVFFRGLIFKGLFEQWRPMGAFIAANSFYAAIHFIKPAQKYYVQEFDPLLGFYHLAHSFERFLDPWSLLPGFFGLFLLGVVLSYAFVRTGSLYLSMGLHMGWVLGIKSIKVYGNYTRPDLGWFFGSSDPKFVSGVATWIGFIIVALIVHWLTRKRPNLSSDPPPEAAA